MKIIIVRDTGQKWEAQMNSKVKRHRKWIAAGVLLLFVLAGAVAVFNHREPDVCALCGSGEGRPYHAPALINLSTGDSIELRVYDMMITNQIEVSPKQTTGTFSPLQFQGHSGYRDTCDQTCHIYIPDLNPALKVRYFCKECRDLLKPHSEAGYVLADAYDQDAIEVYGVFEGAEHTIRDYNVSIQWSTEVEKLEILVHGTIEGLTFID